MNLEAVIQFAVDNGALDDKHLREAIKLFNKGNSQKYICPETSALCGVCKLKCVAQLEQEPVAWIRFDSSGRCRGLLSSDSEDLTESRKAIWQPLYTTQPQPKEPEQRNASEHLEPVAEVRAASNACGQYDVEVRWFGRLPEIGDKLYTSPPYVAAPRQRKPLTDEQILSLVFDSNWTWQAFARAIEAAHGIKE